MSDLEVFNVGGVTDLVGNGGIDLPAIGGPRDTVAPDTFIDGPETGPDTTVLFNLSSDEEDCTFEVRLDGGAWVDSSDGAAHQEADLEVGDHTLEARAQDPAGNVDQTPASWEWTVEPPPAFPVVEGRAINNASSATNHPVALPAGITGDDGELLVTLIKTGSSGPTWEPPDEGWIVIGSHVTPSNGQRVIVAYRDTDGTEGDTALWTSSSSASAGYQTFLISGWGGVPPEIAQATHQSTQPNPPALNPAGWAVKKTLWLAYCGFTSGVNLNAYPADYTDGANSPTIGGLGVARRFNEVESEDPGPFTMSFSVQHNVGTIGIRGT